MSVEGWEFPEELLRLQEEPHTMRRWTPEEAALADISSELQHQHAVVQELLRLPIIVDALWYQGRLDVYERDGFDWPSVQPGRQFKKLHGDGTWTTYTVTHVYGVEAAVPAKVRAWTQSGISLAERDFPAEVFAVHFGGWLDGGDG